MSDERLRKIELDQRSLAVETRGQSKMLGQILLNCKSLVKEVQETRREFAKHDIKDEGRFTALETTKEASEKRLNKLERNSLVGKAALTILSALHFWK